MPSMTPLLVINWPLTSASSSPWAAAQATKNPSLPICMHVRNGYPVRSITVGSRTLVLFGQEVRRLTGGRLLENSSENVLRPKPYLRAPCSSVYRLMDIIWCIGGPASSRRRLPTNSVPLDELQQVLSTFPHCLIAFAPRAELSKD